MLAMTVPKYQTLCICLMFRKVRYDITWIYKFTRILVCLWCHPTGGAWFGLRMNPTVKGKGMVVGYNCKSTKYPGMLAKGKAMPKSKIIISYEVWISIKI